MAVPDPVPAGDDSAAAVAMRRLRWRMRRGMLENDLVLQRAFGAGAPALDADERDALARLLDLPDGELFDLVLQAPGAPAVADGTTARLLDRLRSA